MATEQEKILRGKEICFLEYYFYPWLEKTYGKIDMSRARRIAMAVATLCDCEAWAVEELIQAKDIDEHENKDIRWKTEHNLYPRKAKYWEKQHCMSRAKCPVSIYMCRKMTKASTDLKKWYHNVQEEPMYRGKPLDVRPLFKEEHHDAMEKIMRCFGYFFEQMPTYGAWSFADGYELLTWEGADNGKQ